MYILNREWDLFYGKKTSQAKLWKFFLYFDHELDIFFFFSSSFKFKLWLLLFVSLTGVVIWKTQAGHHGSAEPPIHNIFHAHCQDGILS